MNLQRSLFDRTVPSTAERFAEFHRENPDVYSELVKLARQLKRSGHTRYSIAGLFEVVRFNASLETTSDDGFKINNDYKPLYAREIMEREKDLADFFETRERRVA